MSIAPQPKTLEQHLKTKMTGHDQQVAPHHDRAQQFANEPKHGDPSQQLRAADVQGRRPDDHRNRDRNFPSLTYRDAEQLRDIRSASHRYCGNRGEQSPQVNPPRHPRPPLPHQPPRPGIETARNRELRDNLAEHQRHQQLSQPDKQIAPEHRGPARGQGKRKHRVHADHRRKVGEPEREVRPQTHRAIELRVVPERLKLS